MPIMVGTLRMMQKQGKRTMPIMVKALRMMRKLAKRIG
jgi:hypothetical protein